MVFDFKTMMIGSVASLLAMNLPFWQGDVSFFYQVWIPHDFIKYYTNK
jgi:hypothetical protein